jgi:hypothetical protein
MSLKQTFKLSTLILLVLPLLNFASTSAKAVNNGIISGLVFEDRNNNGILDPEEKTIPNVVINIYRANNTLFDATTTDSNGMYKFDGLPIDNYYIQFFPSASGYQFSLQNVGDPASDSDADPNTGKTNILDLNSNPVRPNINAGLTTKTNTIVACDAFPLSFLSFSRNINVPKFNPVLGTLTKAELTFNSLADRQIGYENTDRDDIANITVNSSTFIDITLPNGSSIPTRNFSTNLNIAKVPAYDGNTDFAGISGNTFFTEAQAESFTQNFNQVQDFIAVNNGDVLNVTVNATGTSRIRSDVGASAGFVRNRATAGVCATYTYTPPAPKASIGVAKRVVTIEQKKVTLDFVLKNYGNLPLDKLSLTDDFDATFGANNYRIIEQPKIQVPADRGSTFVVVNNNGFTGTGNGQEMLDRNNSKLLPQETVTIRLVVEVINPLVGGDGNGKYLNNANTSGTAPNNNTVTDASTDGSDPDRDNDGNNTNDGDNDPTNNTSPTPIVIADLSLGPANLVLVKRITAVNRGTANQQIFDNIYVNDSATGDNEAGWPLPLDSASGISSYLSGAISDVKVQPGDEIEYTIYFLSNGGSDVVKARICDVLLPNGGIGNFVANTFGTGRGIGFNLGAKSINSNDVSTTLTNIVGDDRGSLYSPNTTAPAACNSPAFNSDLPPTQNLYGAVLVDIDRLPSFINSQANGNPGYGFIRFRTRIE